MARSSRVLRGFIPLAFTVTLVLASATGLLGQGTRAFLKLEGVEGDVTEPGYERQIALVSFSLVDTMVNNAPPGQNVSMVRCLDISIALRPSFAMPVLMLSEFTGKHYSKATITVDSVVQDGQHVLPLTANLTDVLVRDARISWQDNGGAAEAYRLVVGTFRLTSTAADGKVRTAGWDCKARRPI